MTRYDRVRLARHLDRAALHYSRIRADLKNDAPIMPNLADISVNVVSAAYQALEDDAREMAAQLRSKK